MKKRLAILLLAGTFFWTGCGSSNDFVFTNTNNPGIAAPVCQDDAYTTNANTTLTVPAATGVLANDTPNGATLAFAATSAQGGTITGAQDGGFTYSPPANFSGTDVFTYSLGNSGGVVTCKVTITVVAVNGFFVDAATGSDTTGSFTGGKPFATIQAAAAAAPAGSDIVIRPGNYTGTITLENGDRLLGSGSTLITPQGVTRPVLTGPVVLADGNTLDFLRVDGTAGSAIDGIGQNGGTISNCEIANITGGTTVAGIAGDNTRGTWTVSGNTFINGSGAGVVFIASGTDSGTFIVTNNTMTNNGLGAIALVSQDTSNVKASVVGNTFSGNNTVTGNAFEVECRTNSTFCLDLENNTNDGIYSLFDSTVGTSTLSVEQLSVLTTAQPTGAGNTGTLQLSGDTPVSINDGDCGF